MKYQLSVFEKSNIKCNQAPCKNKTYRCMLANRNPFLFNFSFKEFFMCKLHLKKLQKELGDLDKTEKELLEE